MEIRMPPKRKLRVFLCHASQDKPVVRELYQRLLGEGWIDAWLDEEKLLPGQDWDLEIEKAVESVDVVIVCVSSRSVTKEGYVQKEIRKVLDIALEKPEETIFIIPLRLDECDLPRRLRSWHFVDYFPAAQRERAYQRLLQSLQVRLGQLSSDVVHDQAARPDPRVQSEAVIEEKTPVREEPIHDAVELSKTGGEVNIGVSILLLIYFAIATFDAFSPSSDTIEFLLGVSAILAGIALLLRSQIPATVIFKISLIVYLLIYGLNYRLTDNFPAALYLGGLAAAISGIMLAVTIRVPGKNVFYSRISFASFLFLVGIYELVTNIGYSSFTNVIDTLILITSVITSILLWIDL